MFIDLHYHISRMETSKVLTGKYHLLDMNVVGLVGECMYLINWKVNSKTSNFPITQSRVTTYKYKCTQVWNVGTTLHKYYLIYIFTT